MVTDRAAVRSLLCEYVPEAADLIMDRLEPFFVKAERGTYDLGRFTDVTSMALAASLPDVVGERLEGVTLEYVSFSRVAESVESLPPAQRAAVWDKLVTTVQPRFGQDIGRFNDKLDADLGPILRLQIDDLLFKALIEPLWPSFEQNRWDVTSDLFKLEVRATVIKAIEYFVGFGIAGDPEPFRVLDRCLAVLPQTITLGRQEGACNTFITLVD